MTTVTARRVKRGVYPAVFCASVFFCILSGEILVRLFLPFNNPDTFKQRSLQYVPSLFSRDRLKPMEHFVEANRGTDSGKKKQHKELPATGYFINDAGYRGSKLSVRKPEGTVRIIIVGGSTVFDINSKDESPTELRSWPHLVERFLREDRHRVEVINAGIPGHASFDALGRLYSQLWTYEPDYVLFYGSWNDIKYFRNLSPESPLISLFRPLTEQSNAFTEYQGLIDRLLSYSQLYVKVRNQYYRWKFRIGEEGVIPEGAYQDAYSPYAVKQYRLNIELIVDLCRNINAVPILLTEATIVSATNSTEERNLIHYSYQLLTHSALVRAFDETYQIIRSVAQEKKVSVVDLAAELNGRRELFTDAVHLSRQGSVEVARRVADFLSLDLKSRKNAGGSRKSAPLHPRHPAT